MGLDDQEMAVTRCYFETDCENRAQNENSLTQPKHYYEINNELIKLRYMKPSSVIIHGPSTAYHLHGQDEILRVQEQGKEKWGRHRDV